MEKQKRMGEMDRLRLKYVYSKRELKHRMDAYAKRIVGWRVSSQMTTGLVMDALDGAGAV